MKFLFLIILKRHFKTYLLLLITLWLSFFSFKMIYADISRKNMILQKIENFDFDIIAPKGSTFDFMLQALGEKEQSDNVLPRSLFTTLTETLKVDVQILEPLRTIQDPVWKTDVVHMGLVKSNLPDKERLKTLINKKTVAQYIDVHHEKKILIEQFSTDQSKVYQIVLFLILMQFLMLYLISGLQYQLYQKISAVFIQSGYSRLYVLKNFYILYFILVLLSTTALII